ncbi:hypothetical protein COC54_20360 [Bacillus pseudomycoides]|nr:hypothetical protein CN564_23310 [Bacillus pseudomycoides]PGS02112.1 hypothetical protein COC54_20360 [Bacillus pseudomycoides]PHC93753.1 hypothetical protein COF36_14650 [Bacillus pseudomycoides]
MKKGKKNSASLLLIAFITLVVTEFIDNLYISAVSVIFALAVVAAVITEKIGEWRNRRKGTHD